VPAITPSGKPANVGVVVATPAVPVPGEAVAAWMCDAVVLPVSPENVTCTCMVWATGSMSTCAVPVPGDAFGGDSLGPVRVARYVLCAACEDVAAPTAIASAANAASPSTKEE